MKTRFLIVMIAICLFSTGNALADPPTLPDAPPFQDQGPQGEPGPQGPQGETGPQGPQGETGPQGPQGETGPQGPQGVAGADGADGKDGVNGTNGTDGKDGVNGTNGKDGVNGQDGKQGVAGKEGKEGDKGDKGDKGDQGIAGKDADSDANAEAGIAGAIAIASLDHARNGGNMAGIAIGAYKEGQAIALGLGTSWMLPKNDNEFKELTFGVSAFWATEGDDDDLGLGSSVNLHW